MRSSHYKCLLTPSPCLACPAAMYIVVHKAARVGSGDSHESQAVKEVAYTGLANYPLASW